MNIFLVGNTIQLTLNPISYILITPSSEFLLQIHTNEIQHPAGCEIYQLTHHTHSIAVKELRIQC